MRFLIKLSFSCLLLFYSFSVLSDSRTNALIYVNGIANSINDAIESKDALYRLVDENAEICGVERCVVDLSYNSSEGFILPIWDWIELNQYSELEKSVATQALQVYIDTVVAETQTIRKKINSSGENDLIDNRVLAIIEETKEEISKSDFSLLFDTTYGKQIESFVTESRDYNTEISEKFIKLIVQGYKLKYPLSSSSFERYQSILLTSINFRKKNLDLVFSNSYRSILANQTFSSVDSPYLSDQLYLERNIVIEANADRLVNRIKKHITLGRNVVVVAHSQGNHVVQSAYSKLEQEYISNNLKIEDYVQVVGLGVVASSSPSNTYLTWDEDDAVLRAYNYVLLGSPLPPNFVETEGGQKNDSFDHNFVKVYLASNIKGQYKHNDKGNISELPVDVQTTLYSVRSIVEGLIKSSFKKMEQPIISFIRDVRGEIKRDIIEGDSGEKLLKFEVILSGGNYDENVSLDIETKDITATAGLDYKKLDKQTITFHHESNERNIAISVPIFGDTVVEENEVFSVVLSNPVGAEISENAGEAAGIIEDDDLPVVSIVDEITVKEGDIGTNFINVPISVSNISAQRIDINLEIVNGTAKEGSDYLAPDSTSIQILPGERGGTQTIFIVMDTIEELDETFIIRIKNVSNATIGNDEALVTIIDDDGTGPDTAPPVITLNGDNSITIHKGSSYIELGATAIDNVDGNVAVTLSGTVNPSIVGTYTITYSATDSAGNTSSLTRIVNVVAPTPIITSVVPDTANVYATVAQNFVVTGENLTDSITMQLDDCPLPALQTGGSAIQRVFRCTPLTEGTKSGVVTDGDVQKNFTMTVESKPDTVATGSITSPLAGSTQTTEQIEISFNVEDLDGLKKVSLVFVQNGTPYVICEDGTTTLCTGTSLTKTVSVNLADYGAVAGQVNIGLWVTDEGSEATPVDSVLITWNLVPTPIITSVQPDTANVYASVSQHFVVTGENLTDSIAMQLDDCPSPMLQESGSATQRIFRCTPLTVGPKSGVITDNEIQQSFSVNVEEKPDSASTGEITSPLAGSTHTTTEIQIIVTVEDLDILKKVSLTFKENGPSYAVCDDETAIVCNGTQVSKTVTLNPADYGAVTGQLDIGLWARDYNDQDTRVDSAGITWLPVDYQPQNVVAAPGDSQVSLSWDAVSNATGYDICYATEVITDPIDCATLQNGTLLTNSSSPTVITGLTNGTEYHFIVIPKNVDGNGIASVEVVATPVENSLLMKCINEH